METKSFHDLISDYVIEVPIIQREYAQGRKSDRVTAIRNRFVEDLVYCVKNNKVMHLGFVYGKVEGKDKQRRKQINRDALNSILQAVKSYADSLELKIDPIIKDNEITNYDQTQLKFIPLDGQQRLTTLYLLHWYLYLKGAKSLENSWVHHFNYTNRKSTMDFLKVINQSKNYETIKKRINAGIDLKSVIKESSFYLQKWNKDKTVLGMLEMLLAIENEFKKIEDFDISQLNLKNLEFKFDFMDLDALNQTNELYVKMNSRGKQLSNYEHFKSWLQNEHEVNKENQWYDEFWRNLDNKWLNFFWKRLNADFNRLDDFYFNFLKNMALMHTIASHPEIPLDSFKELISLIRNDNTYNANKISYIPFEKFYIKWKEVKVDEESGQTKEVTKKQFLFSKENLKFIENTFNTLINIEANPDNCDFLDKVLCQPFIEKSITDFYFDKNEFTPSQPDAVFHYAFIALHNKYKDLEDEHNIREWLRINRNLIYNTYIQNPQNLYDALRQINYLIVNSSDFETQIINDNIKNLFFDSSQFNEEVLKAKLIKGGDNWYDSIVESENHKYFFGQIKFMLNFSQFGEESFDLNEFIKYSKASNTLFNDVIRLSNEKLLERSLLSLGDYLPYYKSNHLFCEGSAGGLRTRNENWRLFFKGEKIHILKELIDKLNNTSINKETLQQLIDDRLDTSNLPLWDWRRLFLSNYGPISFCKSGFIRKYSENDIRLLKGPKIIGYHAELRSYCFYLENKESLLKFQLFENFKILEEKNSDGHPGCSLRNFFHKKKEYILDIRFTKELGLNKFELTFYHFKDKEERKIDDILIDILSSHDFILDTSYNHYFRSVDYSQTKLLLETMFKEIQISIY